MGLGGANISGKTSLRSRLLGDACGVATLAALLGPGVVHAQALPTGAQIVAGAAQINAAANSLVINQSSASLAVNWQSFGIAAGNSVIFNQPGASAVALNRVLGSNASEIFGSLQANGHVFLLNPNGVLFGKGAQVNVGSLVASTGSIADADFAKGKYRITGAGGGSIVNQGLLTAKGGSIVLAAGRISNQGSVIADGGSAALAAGEAFTLTLDHAGLINVRVDQAAIDAQVANHGLIQADGGRVLLTARGRDMALDSVVNNQGVVRAQGLSTAGGQVVLDGGDGAVVNAGVIDVTNAAGRGGEAHIIGDAISLSTASRINATGRDGGGVILVGGDAHGVGPMPTARAVEVMIGAELRADATVTGNGGKVVIWSDQT
ncbi:MAG: filamentous hemagglutinin N-terminal domain-containing protein, partial [Sphingobium sp.]